MTLPLLETFPRDPFAVTAAFQHGKHPDPSRCEDAWADGDDFTVVVDGSTDKTGLRFDGRTGGWVVAQLVADVVSGARSGTSGVDLVEAINAEYAHRLGRYLRDVPDHLRPSGVFVALDKKQHRIVRVGDAQYLAGQDARDSEPRDVDRVAADARAALLHLLLAGGASVSELAADDPGRAMVMPLLLARAHARNTVDVGPALRHGVIDGRPVPEVLVEDVTLGAACATVVLATDGYPRLFGSLEQCEAYLAEDLAADPLRIGRHPGTKAHDPANASYDDRTWVRLDVAGAGTTKGLSVGR